MSLFHRLKHKVAHFDSADLQHKGSLTHFNHLAGHPQLALPLPLAGYLEHTHSSWLRSSLTCLTCPWLRQLSPTCFRSARILPVPQHSAATALCDLHSVALTRSSRSAWKNCPSPIVRSVCQPLWVHTNWPIPPTSQSKMPLPLCSMLP